MKARTIIPTLIALTLSSIVLATEDSLQPISLPLYAPQDRIIVSKVPVIVRSGIPEELIELITQPYIPPSNSAKKQSDINAASTSGVIIETERIEFQKFKVTINFEAVAKESRTQELLLSLVQCIQSVTRQHTISFELTGLEQGSELHQVLPKTLRN